MSENKTSQSFESTMDRLTSIVESLNNTSIPLDEAFKLFEEGLQCVKSCDSTLKQYEKQYNELVEPLKKEDSSDAGI